MVCSFKVDLHYRKMFSTAQIKMVRVPKKCSTVTSYTHPIFYPVEHCKITFWHGCPAHVFGQCAEILPNTHAAAFIPT